MKDLLARLKVYKCIAFYYFKEAKRKHIKKKFKYDPGSQKQFESVINDLPSKKIFVHVALSAAKKFSSRKNPYDYLFEVLTKNFESVLSNAFTPSVKNTKTFNPDIDIPEHGAFAKFFFGNCTFRNYDPLYSVCGLGKLEFNENTLSFSENGLFKQMVEKNYYGLNIDIGNITSSLLHLIEIENKLPYIHFYNDEFTIEKHSKKNVIRYLCYKYKKKYSVKNFVRFNRNKILKDLGREKIVHTYNIGGVKVYYFNMKSFYDFINGKVKKDPFYLVT